MTTKVKGAVLLARCGLVKQEFGAQAWQEVLDSLPAEDREALTGPLLTASWYPFELNQRLDAAIVATVGKGEPKIFEAIGARSARDNLSGPHRAFLTAGDPQRFMSGADRIYKFYYDTGYRVYEPTGPASGVMTTFEAETFSEPDCLTVIGWYKEALRMCGAENVVMEEEVCRARGGEFCRYRISWETPAGGAGA